jgi:hypothetical protein
MARAKLQHAACGTASGFAWDESVRLTFNSALLACLGSTCPAWLAMSLFRFFASALPFKLFKMRRTGRFQVLDRILRHASNDDTT